MSRSTCPHWPRSRSWLRQLTECFFVSVSSPKLEFHRRNQTKIPNWEAPEWEEGIQRSHLGSPVHGPNCVTVKGHLFHGPSSPATLRIRPRGLFSGLGWNFPFGPPSDGLTWPPSLSASPRAPSLSTQDKNRSRQPASPGHQQGVWLRQKRGPRLRGRLPQTPCPTPASREPPPAVLQVPTRDTSKEATAHARPSCSAPGLPRAIWTPPGHGLSKSVPKPRSGCPWLGEPVPRSPRRAPRRARRKQRDER